MGQRLDLQTSLEAILGSGNVYFQPPEDYKLQYPCILYKRDYARAEYADNAPYRHSKRYQVIIITQDPDSPIPDRVAELPTASFERHYAAGYLNHDVYTLFF